VGREEEFSIVGREELRSEEEIEEGLGSCCSERECKGSIMGKFEDGTSGMMLGKTEDGGEDEEGRKTPSEDGLCKPTTKGKINS
jgi:hypothetical protein